MHRTALENDFSSVLTCRVANILVLRGVTSFSSTTGARELIRRVSLRILVNATDGAAVATPTAKPNTQYEQHADQDPKNVRNKVTSRSPTRTKRPGLDVVTYLFCDPSDRACCASKREPCTVAAT